MNWRQLLRNIGSNWLGYFVTVTIGFFLAPFVVHRLGDTQYGIWTLVLSLTGYFGLLDLGIRSSVGRFVARYISLDDSSKVNEIVSSAMFILSGGSALGLIAILGLQYFFDGFRIDPSFAGPARAALFIAGLNVVIALPLGVFSSVLVALERFDVITAISVAGALTRASLVICLLSLNYGLLALAVVTIAVSLAESSGMVLCAKHFYPALAPRRRFIRVTAAKELLGFGLYRFVWIVANQLIFYTDSVVIGLFLGAGAITYYSIAGSLVNYARNIVSLATDTLYPAAARLDTKRDLEGLRDLQVFGTSVAILVGFPICAVLIFLGKQFITLWMGQQYSISARYLVVLMIPQVASMSQYTSALILAAMARHRVLAYIVICEALANLILSIILVRKFGLIGVAWGTTIPHLISSLFLVPGYTLRTLHMPVLSYVKRGIVRPVLCAVPTAALCYGLSLYVDRPSWALFVAELLAVVAVAAALSCAVCLTSSQREALISRVQLLLRRETVVNEA